eukprot:262896_1
MRLYLKHYQEVGTYHCMASLSGLLSTQSKYHANSGLILIGSDISPTLKAKIESTFAHLKYDIIGIDTNEKNNTLVGKRWLQKEQMKRTIHWLESDDRIGKRNIVICYTDSWQTMKWLCIDRQEHGTHTNCSNVGKGLMDDFMHLDIRILKCGLCIDHQEHGTHIDCLNVGNSIYHSTYELDMLSIPMDMAKSMTYITSSSSLLIDVYHDRQEPPQIIELSYGNDHFSNDDKILIDRMKKRIKNEIPIEDAMEILEIKDTKNKTHGIWSSLMSYLLNDPNAIYPHWIPPLQATTTSQPPSPSLTSFVTRNAQLQSSFTHNSGSTSRSIFTAPSKHTRSRFSHSIQSIASNRDDNDTNESKSFDPTTIPILEPYLLELTEIRTQSIFQHSFVVSVFQDGWIINHRKLMTQHDSDDTQHDKDRHDTFWRTKDDTYINIYCGLCDRLYTSWNSFCSHIVHAKELVIYPKGMQHIKHLLKLISSVRPIVSNQDSYAINPIIYRYCNNGHRLLLYKSGLICDQSYQTGFICDDCGASYDLNMNREDIIPDVWHCKECSYDMCMRCYTKKDEMESNTPTQQTQPLSTQYKEYWDANDHEL